jgi:hypothetical protein
MPATCCVCDQSTSDELVVVVDRCIPIYRSFFLQFSGCIVKPWKSRIVTGGSAPPRKKSVRIIYTCARAYLGNVFCSCCLLLAYLLSTFCRRLPRVVLKLDAMSR